MEVTRDMQDTVDTGGVDEEELHSQRAQPPLEVTRDVQWNVPCGFRAHSSIPKSEASVLLDMTTKSAKKLMVEPAATWVGLCSAAVHDVLYVFFSSALVLNALKPWLVRPAQESCCTVISRLELD